MSIEVLASVSYEMEAVLFLEKQNGAANVV